MNEKKIKIIITDGKNAKGYNLAGFRARLRTEAEMRK
jgi:hypothetical protein